MFFGGTSWRVWLCLILLGATGFLLLPTRADAAINSEINFQGKLTNPDGTNVTDGSYSIRFRIYNHVSLDGAASCMANSCLWEETQGTVSLSDGIFRVALGSSTSLSAVDFNSAPLYLGVKVGTDAEMTPRIEFTATPYAFNSDTLDGLSSEAFGQLASSQTWTGTNTFQPTTNISSAIVRQSSFGSPTADIFNIQTANSTNILQVTGPAANESAVTLRSVGATRALTLDSGSGTIVVGTTTTTLQKSGTALTVDLNNAANSTVTITNAGAGVASLSVEGGVTVGANQDITTTAGTGTLTLNSTVANASDSAILVNPNFTGGATDGLTYNAISVAAFSPTNAAGTDNINGLSVGNLTDPGATVSSRAITLGTGWDTLIGGTTAGTNLLSFTNYSVSSAGSVNIATGQSYTGAGVVNLSSGGANALNLDTGGGAVLNIGTTNATSIVIGGNASATLTQRVATSSTTAYTLQGAGGADFMIVDSTNNRLQIGDTVADATAVLLILDTKNTTGDPTGVNGGQYYNSANNKFRCYEGSVWGDCGNGFNTLTKTADQAATISSTTFQDDNTLFFTAGANTTYVFDAWIPVNDTNTTADLKYTFTTPTGATQNILTSYYSSATATVQCNIITSGQTCANTTVNRADHFIQVKGQVTVAGTAGQIRFRFAQNGSNANPFPVIKKGATLSWRQSN